MSSLKNIAIGAGVTVVVLGGAAYLMKMQRTTAELEVINQANLHKINLTGLYIRIDSVLKNPAAGSFNLKFPFVKLIYNDAVIGTSQVIDKDIHLPAYGEAHVEGIMVHVPIVSLLSLGFKIFSALKKGEPIEMQAKTISTIDLGWKHLPYEVTQNIVLKK
ncbi:MAG: hypothetical protein RJA07_466 [Bacteroidota bacterium]|jgi:hypothetical protein